MNNKCMQELMGVLFISRDFAHKRHLSTRSFAEHSALNSFYEDIILVSDKLAETWQGKNLTLIGEVPCLKIAYNEPAAKGLKEQLDVIEGYRKEVTGGYSPLENIFDEIASVYLATIYKLTFLK